MSVFNGFMRKNKMLLIAEDGTGLRGIIATDKEVCTETHFPLNTGLNTVLESGKKQGARDVLFLRSSEVREIDVRLGPDLDMGERHSAIEYAAAGNFGDHSGTQIISYMDGMLHDFRSGILVSYFDAQEIAEASNAARNEKISFMGMTNFKQLLMAEHFSNTEHHNEAFLLLLGNHGFAAVPERNKLLVRNLPFGVPSAGEETEWVEKLQRRLTMLKHKNVTLYSPDASPGLDETIRITVEAENVVRAEWEDALERSAVFFLQNGKKLIRPALPPPKPKDPKAPGTVIGLTLLGTVTFAMTFLFLQSYFVHHSLETRYKENQAIEKRVKNEEAKIKKLQAELAAEQEIYQMMEKKQRVSSRLLLVINLLSRYQLQYTKLNSLSEELGGIFIEGETIWQPDLSKFFTHFEGELSKYSLNLFPDGLSKDKDGRIMFRAHIGGGKQ